MITCKFENGNDGQLRHATVDSIVLNDQGHILLVKRSMKLNYGGKWCLPGGFLDRGETTAEGAARETLEETGWTISDQKLLTIIDTPERGHEDRQNVTFIYQCQAKEKVGEPDWESDETKFFPLDELPEDTQIAFDHREIIATYVYLDENPHLVPLLGRRTQNL